MFYSSNVANFLNERFGVNIMAVVLFTESAFFFQGEPLN